MGVRLPTILGKAIDDVVKTLNEQVRGQFTRCLQLYTAILLAGVKHTDLCLLTLVYTTLPTLLYRTLGLTSY